MKVKSQTILELTKHIDVLETSLSDIKNLVTHNQDFLNDSFDSSFDSSFVEAVDRSIRDVLDIRQHLDESRYFIGVFGGFSCGKSTFINAFLEKRFLAEALEAGTTCCETCVTFSEKENVIVEYKDGGIKKLYDSVSGIRSNSDKNKELIDFIHKVTADEKTAKDIEKVTWESPIPVLQDGLVFVDTPGLESSNDRHTEVARHAARRCDALLVLTSMHQALSKTLLDEVQNIAGRKAMGCIFVGTRFDQIPAEEYTRQKKFFQEKLKNEFSRSCPFYFVSALKALKELESLSDAKGEQKWLGHFRKFRSEIIDLLVSNREMIQSAQLSNLVSHLSEEIEKELNLLGEEINRIKEKKSSLEKRKHFFDPSQEIQWRLKQFDRSANDIKNSIKIDSFGKKSLVNTFIERLKKAIRTQINACKSEDGMKVYLKTGINSTFSRFNDEFKELVTKELVEPVIKTAQGSQEEFAQKIRQQCEELSQEFGDVPRFNYGDSQKVQIKDIKTFDKSGKILYELSVEDGGKIARGMGAGIALSLVIPGVGWIAGGLIALAGGVLGALFSSLDEKKKKAFNQVAEHIDGMRSQLSGQMETAYTNIHHSVHEKMESALQVQEELYNSVVDRYKKKFADDMARLEKIEESIHSYRQTFMQIKASSDKIHESIAERMESKEAVA